MALLAIILLTPAAAAAPFNATLHARTPIGVEGGATFTLQNPGLHMQLAAGRGGDTPLKIEFEEARVIRVYREATVLKSPRDERLVRSQDPDVKREEISFTNARLSVTSANPTEGQVLLFPSDGTYTALLSAQIHDAALGPVNDATVVRPVGESPNAVRVGKDDPIRFTYIYEGNALRMQHAFDATATGEFSIYFWGIDFTIANAEGREHDFRTGENEEPGGNEMVHRERLEYIIIKVTGGTAQMHSPDGMAAYAHDLTISLDGRATLHDVSGHFEAAGRRYVAENERSATFTGNLTLKPEFRVTGGTEKILPGQLLGRGWPITVTLSGDLEATSLRSIPAQNPAHFAAVAGAAAIATGAGALSGRFAWLFYWRLQPGSVMKNKNRLSLLEVARARPGLTPAELAREAGVPLTTAKHHLRVLARFGYVVLTQERAGSHVRRVFSLEMGDSSDSSRALPAQVRAVQVALAREPCRRVAQAFLKRAEEVVKTQENAACASLPSLSLSEIARATGLTRPTALRHVRRLVNAGVAVVSGENLRTRKYALTTKGLNQLRAHGNLLLGG